MFRTQRNRRFPLLLVLALTLLPLPASAGGFWEQGAVTGAWEGLWGALFGWIGLIPATAEDSSYIDPNGQPKLTTPSVVTSEDSSSIDPLGQPKATPPAATRPDDSSLIDPNG